MKRGQDYDKLKKQYIIFICTFDPYGGGLHRYTFTNRCRETSQEMGDGTCKVFLNTRGTADDVSKELKAFLDFVEDSSPQNAERLDDDFVRNVSRRVESIKADEEMGGVFMTFEEKLDEAAKEAAKEATRETIEDQARKMKQKGYPLEDIMEISGLCREEIEGL